MKKIIKYSILSLILPIMMLFSACSCTIGVCKIEFETWDGSEIDAKSFSPGYELSEDDFKYTEPTKKGYNFVNWCYKDDLEDEISFPMYCDWDTYKYYAKYEIDTDYFDANHIVRWESPQEQIIFENSLYANDSMVILLDKTTLYSALNKITVESTHPTPGQGLFIDSVSVYDENGKTVKDKNESNENFEPEEKLSDTAQFKYVVMIKAGSRGGDFRVTFN